MGLNLYELCHEGVLTGIIRQVDLSPDKKLPTTCISINYGEDGLFYSRGALKKIGFETGSEVYLLSQEQSTNFRSESINPLSDSQVKIAPFIITSYKKVKGDCICEPHTPTETKSYIGVSELVFETLNYWFSAKPFLSLIFFIKSICIPAGTCSKV